MKTKSAAKSSKAAENKERKSLAVETNKKPRNKTPAAKSKSNAKKDSSSEVTIPDRLAKTIDSPEVYKNVHNIGRRRANERVVSYKETEIAICFKDSYWPNAKVDLGGPSRSESSQGRTAQEKSSSMSHHLDEKSPKVVDRAETKQKPDKNVPSEPKASGEGSASSGIRGSVLNSKTMTSKASRGRRSPVSRRASHVSDAKKCNDAEVDALLSAAVSSDGDDSESSKRQLSPKRSLQLSSKKRAELSFLARGVSASGCSDVFNRRPKGSDNQQYVRTKRTASLNAGAIMSLMLQKEEPSVSKRDKMHWDESDNDSDLDDSSSESSESADSTFSEYSMSCASRLIKRPTKVLTSTTGALASSAASVPTPAKVDFPKESTGSLKEKEMVILQREKHIASTESALRAVPALSDEVIGLAKFSAEKEKAGSPLIKTGSHKQSINFLKGTTNVPKDSLSLGTRTMKKSSEAKPLPVATNTKSASPSPPKSVGSDSIEGKGKRKRKEFEDYVPILVPGRRMASLNAQAILVASRDDRVKRSRLSGEGRSFESETKASSTLTHRHSEFPMDNSLSKTTERSPPDSGKTTQRGAAVCADPPEMSSAKKIVGTSVSDSMLSTSNFCLSTMPKNTGDVGVQYAGTYVEMVSPPSSVQLVEMTSTPVLTPNKTYQQLDRPPNCQQYSSDRQVTPAWAGNPYGVAQFHEMQSNNDFHKSSSDRPLDKAQSNIVTALIPHATSLAPAVPLRFTAHIVPQNPLPQQGFYGQLQPHPSYFSERYPYAGTNLFSYQTKAFGTNTSFATPHIPSDLYNASRQLQVYEVQATRPVYARQSDFNLQLCPPQFIAPLTSPPENREHLYRPYLSPPGHQSFQHAQHPTMCTPYMAPPVQVALSVPSVNHPPSDKQLGPPMSEGHSVGSEQKMLKSSPSESQPNLTDISYSVVKRSGVQRRRQVETKHSSTQVKCHEVAFGSSCGSHHSGKQSPDHLKSTGTKLPAAEAKREKCEEAAMSAEVVCQGSASAHKVAPPAHCQSYAAGSKLSDGMDDLCYTDLRNYNAIPCKASPVGLPLQKEYLTKKEESKPTVIEISDTKPRLDSRDLIPGVSYLKPDSCGVHIDSPSPLKSPQRKPKPPREASPGGWPRDVSAEMHRLGAFAIQTSIIDLSQEKELDLSKKSNVSETPEGSVKRPHCSETLDSSGKMRKISEFQESSGEAVPPQKKKVLKNRKTAKEEFTNTVKATDSLDSRRNAGGRNKVATGGQESTKLVPVSVGSSESKSIVPVSRADDPVSSCLSQLEFFVSHHQGRKPGHDVLQGGEVHSEGKTEQHVKSDVEILTLAKESQDMAVLKIKSSMKDDSVVGTSHHEDSIVRSAVAGESTELSESSRCNVKKQECINAEVVLPVMDENMRNIHEQTGPCVTSKSTLKADALMVQIQQPTVVEESTDLVIDLTKPDKQLYEKTKSAKFSDKRQSIVSAELTLANNSAESIGNLEKNEGVISKAKSVCCEVEIAEATSNDKNAETKATDSDEATLVTYGDVILDSKSENDNDIRLEVKPAASHAAKSKENPVKSEDLVLKPKPATSNDASLEAETINSDASVSEAALVTQDDTVAEANPVISDCSKSDVNLAINDDTGFVMKISTSEDAAVEAKPMVSNDESINAHLGSLSNPHSDAKFTSGNGAKLQIKLTACDVGAIGGKSVTSCSAISEIRHSNSGNGKEKGVMAKSDDTNSQKKYQARISSRQGFAAPMKERGCSKKLSRKRVSSISFGKTGSSKTTHVRKGNDRKLRNTVAASKVCQKRRLNVDVMPELGARRSQKELIESKTKMPTAVGPICKRKAGSEKDKLRRHLSDEAVNQRTDGPKCWKWGQPGSMKLTYTEVEGPPIQKMCYPAIEHTNGDVIQVRDCVFVRSGMRKKDIPYIAKIYSFWEHPETGEMMMGVFWYYRQLHSDSEHVSKYLSNEVFASRHRDIIPVACIEDRCYVLTFNEFCRYKAEQKRQDGNLPPREQKVPVCAEPYSRTVSQPPADVDPDVVFLCRNIYDIKMRRILRLSRKLQT